MQSLDGFTVLREGTSGGLVFIVVRARNDTQELSFHTCSDYEVHSFNFSFTK